MKNSIKLIIIGTITLIFIPLIYFKLIKKEKTSPPASNPTTKQEEEIKLAIDFNSDGIKEKIVITKSEGESIKSMTAYDNKNNVVGLLPPDLALPFPDKDLSQTVKLKTDEAKEYPALNFVVGPHQSLVMLFDLSNDQILPFCNTLKPLKLTDCTFWASDPGYIQYADLDGDKKVEVVEYVDEYPADGTLSPEELNAITNGDYEKNIESNLLRVTKREKGGRGRKAIWAIYKYNGDSFSELKGRDYDKFYSLAVATNYLNFNPIKKTKLSKESIDYNEFTFQLWTGQLKS